MMVPQKFFFDLRKGLDYWRAAYRDVNYHLSKIERNFSDRARSEILLKRQIKIMRANLRNHQMDYFSMQHKLQVERLHIVQSRKKVKIAQQTIRRMRARSSLDSNEHQSGTIRSLSPKETSLVLSKMPFFQQRKLRSSFFALEKI